MRKRKPGNQPPKRRAIKTRSWPVVLMVDGNPVVGSVIINADAAPIGAFGLRPGCDPSGQVIMFGITTDRRPE